MAKPRTNSTSDTNMIRSSGKDPDGGGRRSSTTIRGFTDKNLDLNTFNSRNTDLLDAFRYPHEREKLALKNTVNNVTGESTVTVTGVNKNVLDTVTVKLTSNGNLNSKGTKSQSGANVTASTNLNRNQQLKVTGTASKTSQSEPSKSVTVSSIALGTQSQNVKISKDSTSLPVPSWNLSNSMLLQKDNDRSSTQNFNQNQNQKYDIPRQSSTNTDVIGSLNNDQMKFNNPIKSSSNNLNLVTAQLTNASPGPGLGASQSLMNLNRTLESVKENQISNIKDTKSTDKNQDMVNVNDNITSSTKLQVDKDYIKPKIEMNQIRNSGTSTEIQDDVDDDPEPESDSDAPINHNGTDYSRLPLNLNFQSLPNLGFYKACQGRGRLGGSSIYSTTNHSTIGASRNFLNKGPWGTTKSQLRSLPLTLNSNPQLSHPALFLNSWSQTGIKSIQAIRVKKEFPINTTSNLGGGPGLKDCTLPGSFDLDVEDMVGLEKVVERASSAVVEIQRASAQQLQAFQENLLNDSDNGEIQSGQGNQQQEEQDDHVTVIVNDDVNDSEFNDSNTELTRPSETRTPSVSPDRFGLDSPQKHYRMQRESENYRETQVEQKENQSESQPIKDVTPGPVDNNQTQNLSQNFNQNLRNPLLDPIIMSMSNNINDNDKNSKIVPKSSPDPIYPETNILERGTLRQALTHTHGASRCCNNIGQRNSHGTNPAALSSYYADYRRKQDFKKSSMNQPKTNINHNVQGSLLVYQSPGNSKHQLSKTETPNLKDNMINRCFNMDHFLLQCPSKEEWSQIMEQRKSMSQSVSKLDYQIERQSQLSRQKFQQSLSQSQTQSQTQSQNQSEQTYSLNAYDLSYKPQRVTYSLDIGTNQDFGTIDDFYETADTSMITNIPQYQSQQYYQYTSTRPEIIYDPGPNYNSNTDSNSTMQQTQNNGTKEHVENQINTGRNHGKGQTGKKIMKGQGKKKHLNTRSASPGIHPGPGKATNKTEKTQQTKTHQIHHQSREKPQISHHGNTLLKNQIETQRPSQAQTAAPGNDDDEVQGTVQEKLKEEQQLQERQDRATNPIIVDAQITHAMPEGIDYDEEEEEEEEQEAANSSVIVDAPITYAMPDSEGTDYDDNGDDYTPYQSDQQNANINSEGQQQSESNNNSDSENNSGTSLSEDNHLINVKTDILRQLYTESDPGPQQRPFDTTNGLNSTKSTGVQYQQLKQSPVLLYSSDNNVATNSFRQTGFPQEYLKLRSDAMRLESYAEQLTKLKDSDREYQLHKKSYNESISYAEKKNREACKIVLDRQRTVIDNIDYQYYPVLDLYGLYCSEAEQAVLDFLKYWKSQKERSINSASDSDSDNTNTMKELDRRLASYPANDCQDSSLSYSFGSDSISMDLTVIDSSAKVPGTDSTNLSKFNSISRFRSFVGILSPRFSLSRRILYNKMSKKEEIIEAIDTTDEVLNDKSRKTDFKLLLHIQSRNDAADLSNDIMELLKDSESNDKEFFSGIESRLLEDGTIRILL